MYLEIKEGAVFIADAHENESTNAFWDFLKFVESGDIQTPQLFLMGDMFDLLVGEVSFCANLYAKYIELIEKISLHVEIYYLEGNHDFNLKDLFSNVKVVKIESQPLACSLPNGQKMLLLHGDKYGDTLHNIFTCIIRNSTFLSFLNVADKAMDGYISKKIKSNQRNKKLCEKIPDFRTKVEQKLSRYDLSNISLVAEGHYHQNSVLSFEKIRYINFSSFACNQSYFIVQSSQDTEFAQKQLRGCNV
ncbi:MAG: UDP-2,3-diacylglucosamine diphosphatase [Sulfurospirillaceae bacterium]|nr:UDP-2,3-diacylglucosamine diphosphatase [Sulfurospirillaceae bacterium]